MIFKHMLREHNRLVDYCTGLTTKVYFVWSSSNVHYIPPQFSCLLEDIKGANVPL